MWQFETRFSETITRAPGVKSFRIPISPAEAPFQLGHYFFVTIKVAGAEALHHFTISSSPFNPYLELTMRTTDPPYSLALDAAEPVQFTFYRTEENRWEGRDYEVAISNRE